MTDDERRGRAKRRLRVFGFHLMGYIVVMTVLIPVNLLTMPEKSWFVFPLVAWGAPLAIHVAWAMGLLDGLFGGR
ncbi:MAG: 2TM domain-containing protein [Pseudomonadota bacterium]|nr:2TM domain-containing protein [Pseudomonadota bacterium]